MPLSLDTVRRIADLLTRPGCFFVGRNLRLGFAHLPNEEVVWEVFQGRLLDPAHTRLRRSFESWNVYALPDGDITAPLLSLKLDAGEGILHVLRGVEGYVWEGYDAGGNVYQSREVRKWQRELIATFDLSSFDDPVEFREELAHALERAVTGVRLPLMPTEAPLPAFSFGELFYRDIPDDGEEKTGDLRLLTAQLSPERGAGWKPAPRNEAGWKPAPRNEAGWKPAPRNEAGWKPAPRVFETTLEPSRLIEAWLRSVPLEELPAASSELARQWSLMGRSAEELLHSFRRLFNEVSLSPWTDFADKVIRLLALLQDTGTLSAAQVLDFEGHLLRQLGRHLTAYDLVTFHYRGANYPDALLLDCVLADFLARLEREPALFDGEPGRLRRRALRQAWLVRRHYESHPVPDVPTSPGEHARVYPAGYPRVAEEQILQSGRRRRFLYEGDPLLARLSPAVRSVLRQSLADLAHPDERRELSAAVFLDRPFNGAKAPVEPDGTLLLASLATSAFLAGQRWRSLARDLGLAEAEVANIGPLNLPGLPLDRIGPALRAGTVSLADAARAAPDFVFGFTLPGSVSALKAMLHRAPCAGREHLDALTGRLLLARAPRGAGVVIYDEALRPTLELEPRLEGGYASRRGVEYPRLGFGIRR